MALADRYPLLFRALSFFTATTVLTAATASGTHAISLSVGEAVAQYLRNPHGAYTQAPTKPYLGQHPGRDPHGRGGVWTRAALVDAEESAQPLYASTEPAQIPPHSLAVAAEPGTTYPWEGSTNGVNTGNGNKLTKIPLVSWTGRGGMPVEFSLYHNSQTNYEDELGKGWTWSYDIYINNLTGNPVVHWGDGLSIPFTSSDSGGTTTAGGTTGGGEAERRRWRRERWGRRSPLTALRLGTRRTPLPPAFTTRSCTTATAPGR